MFKLLRPAKLKKIVASLTAASLLLTVFASGGFAAPAQPVLPAANALPALNPSSMLIPFNLGRITDALNAGNKRIIVNIQDLHAHEETQRNISSILSMLDAKYGINRIYLEGAAGQLDTSWLAGIKDENFKNAAIDALLRDGKLTGAELYSIKTGKTKILYGMENKELYLGNFKRLGEIYKKRGEIKAAMPVIKLQLENAAQQYYGKENKKFLRMQGKYQSGKLSSAKYLKHLVSKASESGVNLFNYPAITDFAKIAKIQSSFNANKINSQLSELMNGLKSSMPYSQYKTIADFSGKDEQRGTFYLALSDAYYKYGNTGKYAELEKFFDFIRLNQSINPIDLVNEEKQLARETMYRFAKTNGEKEIIFLSDMFASLSDYLDNKISARDYEFFEKNLPEFKTLWEKYVDVSGLPELTAYYDLFDEFYKVNVERNRYFLEQITGKLPEKAQQKVRLVSGEDQKSAAALLDGAKGIDVVITGGFHTNDLAKLMGDNGYSYVVITPNVTQDTALSDKNYENNILEQAAVANNTFKDMVLSSIFNFSAKSGDPAPSIVSRELSFQLLEAAEKTIGLDAFKRVFTDMVLADAQEFKQLNVENIVLDSIAKEGASYKIKFSYVRDGQKYDVEKTIRQEAENKNYDVKEQKKFNIAGAAVVSAAAILLSFFSLPAGIALGIAGLLFHAAGYENAHLVDKAVVDFKNYASHKLNVSPDKVITKTDALRDMELFGGLTQEEYLKRFEEKIQSKDAFLPALKKGITLKSMFDETAPYEVKRAAATTFATVSKSVPNVIYVNPIALYFLDGEAPYLSRIIISKHEQLHVAGGKGIIASIARFIDMRTNGYMHIAERWDDIHASVASAYGISAVSRGILAFFSDTNSERAELNEYAAAIARVKGQIDRNKDKNIDISAQVDEFITAAEKYLIRIKAYPQFTVESLGTYNRNNEVLNNIAELTGYINAVAVYRQGILTNPEETATRLKKIAQGWQYGLGGSIGLKQDYPAVYDKSVKAEEILSIGYMKAKLTEDIKDFLFNLEINTQKEAKSYEEVIDKAEKFMDNSESLFGLLENSTQPEDLDTINEMWNALPYAMKIIKSFSLKDYRTRELAVRMQSLWEASASFLANNGRSQKADQDTEAIMAITDASLSIGGPIKNIFKFFSFGKLAKDKNGKLDKSGRTIGEKFYDENIAPWREMFMVAAAAGREQGKEWFLGKHTAYNRAVSIVKALDIVSKHDNLTAKEYWESFTADDHIKFNKAKELLAKYSAEEIKNAPDLKKEFEKGWETITANAKENAVYKLYSGHIQFIANLALAVAGALEHRRWNKQQWAEGKPESALSLLGNFTFSDGALYTMISGIVLFIVGSVRIDSLYNEKKSGLTYMDKYDIGDKKDYREYREYMDERIKNDRNKYLIYLSIPMMIFGAIFAGFSAGVWSFMGWGLILVSAFAFLFYHNMKDDYWFEDLAVSYFITAVITIMLGIGLVIGTPIVVNKKMEQNRKIALETIKKYTVESGSSAESFDYTLLELLNDMEKQIFSSTKYNFSEEDRIKIYELLKSGTNLDYAQIAGYLEEKIPGQKWKILKSLQNWGIETGVSHTYKYQTAMRDKEVKKLILEKQNIKVFRQIDYELLQAIDKLEDTLNSGFNVRYRFSNEECVRIYELVKNGSYENIADYLLAIMPQLQSSETSSETRKKILNDAFNLFNIFHSAGNLPSDMTFNAIRTAVTKYYIETGLSTDIIDYEILQKMNNLTNRLSLYLTAGTSINPHEFSNEEYVKIYKLAENKDYEAIISYIANKKGKELYETIINSFVKETFYLEKIPAQLTLDSTKKAYIDKLSRILGSRSRAEKFAASKLGTKILIAAFAPFFERKHLMRIMDAFMSSAEDNVKVYDMDEAKEFLGGHAAYDEAAHVLAHPTGVLPSELAAAPNIIREYQKGLDYVIQPSLRAFYAAWKLTGSMFAARLAANIANVITHFFWNLTHPGKALTVDTNNDIDFSSPENKKALSNLVKKLLLDAGLGKYEDWVINDSIEGNSVTIAGHSVYVRADKYWQLISFTTKQIAGGKTICYINRDGSIENSLSEALRTKEDIKREVSRFDFDGDEERNDKLTAEIVQIITDLINESNRVLPVDAEKEKADLLKEKEELAGIASKSGSYAEFISNIAHHKAFDKPRTRQSLITKENYTKKDHKPYYGAYDVEPKGDIWAQVNDQDHIVKRNYIAPLKFHISANVNNSQKIYDLVKPVLDKYNVAYKVPIKLKYLEELNNGWEYGKTQIGKFMTIYLPGGADERVLLDLAIELDAILIQYNFKSPEIANNMVIGSSGILYVRDERRDVEDGRYGPAELDFRDAFDKRKKELLAIWDKNGAGTTKNADNNAGLTADSTKRAFEKWIDRMVKRAGNSSVNEAVEEAIQEFDKKFGVESESIDPNIKSLLKSIILKRIDDNWRLMRNGELPWPSELMYDSVLKEFYAPVYEARAIAKIALAADADEYWIQTLILWYPDVDDNLEPEAVETARIMLSRDKAVTKEKFEHVRDIVKIMSSLGIKIDENSIRSVIAAIESKQTEFNAETASGQKAVIKIDDKGAVKEVIIDGKPADLEELRRNALVSENQANENRQITVAKLDDNSQISGEPLPHNAGRGGMTGAAIKMLSEPGKYKVTGVMVDELGNGYGEVRYFNETVSCVELGDFLKELKEAGYEDLPVVELIMEVSKDAKGNIKREITKIAQRDVEKAGSVYIWKKSKDETAAKKIKGKNDSKIAESLTLNFSDETRKLLLSLGYGIKEIEKLTPKQIQRVEQLSKLLSDLGIRVNKKAVEFAMNYHNIEIEELAQYKNAAEFKELFSGDYDISALTSGRMRRLSMMWSAGLWQNTNENKEVNIQINEAYIEIADNTPKLLPKDFDELIEKFKKYKSENSENKSQFEELLTVYSKYVAEFTPDKIEKIKIFSSFAGGKLTEQIVRSALYSPLNSTDFENFIQEQTKNEPWFKELFSGKYYVDRLIIKDINAASAEFEKYKESGKHEIRPVLAQIEGRAAPTAISLGIYNTETKEFVWQAKNPKRTAGTPNGVLYTSDSTMKHYKTSEAGRRAVEKARKTEEGKKIVDEGLKNNLSKEEIDDRIIIEILAPKYEARTIAKIAELVSIGMITAEQILSGDFLPGSLVGKFLRKHTGYRTGTEDTQKTYREGLVYIVTETLIATNYSTIIDELAKASVAPHKKWNKEHSGAPLATNEGVSLGKVIADTVQELALIADNPASDSAAEIKAIDFVNSSETTFGILLLKESLRPGDLDAIHEIWMGLYYAMKIVNRNRPLNYVIDEDPLGRRIKSLWSNAGSVLAKNGRPEKVVAGIVTEFDIWASHSVNRIKEQNDAAAKTKKGWLSSPIAWIITGISVLFPANLFASNADSIRHILNNEQLTFYTALVLFVVAVVGIFAYAVKTLADLPARQEKESVSSAVQQVNTRIVAEELEKVNRFFVDAERTKERYTEPGVVIVNLEANKSAFGDLSERLAKILGKDAYIIDPKYYHLSVSNAGNVSNEPASQDEVQKVISEIPNEFFEALSKVGGKLKGRFDITTGGQIVYVLDTNSEIPQGFFEAVKKYLPANWSRYDMVRMNLARMYPGVSQEKVKAVADLLNKWNEKNTVSDEVLNGRIVYGQVKSLGEITGEAYSRTYLGAALADFKGRNGYQTHKRDNGEFRSARSIDEMLKTINELSANNIDYYEIVLQGLTPSGSNYDGYRDILNNDFWLVGIFSKNSQFDLDTTLKDLKHDFEIRAEEVKKAAEAKGIKLIAHLQGQPPDSGAWWPNYDNDGKEALNGLTKILDAQLEIAGLLGITSLVLHLNGDKNNEEAMKGYVAFIEKAASMGITINLENEIIYEKNDYNHNTTLGERGFADYRTFIDALEEINKGLSENGRKHMGALIDTGKALQSFTDNSKTDAAGNISDEEFNLQTAKINLEHLKEYYEAVRKAGFNINEIHLAQSSVLPSDVKDEKGKDGKGRKVFYKKTRIEENKNPNLYISDFLTFLNEKTENNETRFKGVVIQETDGFTVPAGKSATQEAPAEQKDKVFEPIKNRFDEAVSVYRKEKTDDNARELIKAAYSYVLASDRNVTQALETQKAVDAALKEFGFKDSSIYERFWPDNKAPKYSLNNEKYRWVDTIIRFVEKPIFASDWDKFYEAKSIKERIERVIKDAGVEFGYERKENGAHFNFYKNSMSIELTGKDFSDFGERQVEILKKIIDNGGYTGVKFVKNDSDARSCTITFELGKVEEVADAEQSLIKLAAAEQNLIKIFDEFKKQSESGNASATAEKVTSAVSTQQPAAKPASSFTARVTAFIALLLFPLSLFVSESLPVSNISGMGHGFIIVGILAVVAAAAILLQVFGIIKPWYASYGALRTEGRIKQTANDFGKEAEIKSEGNIFTRNYTLSAYADDKNADGKNIDMLLKIFQEYPRFAAERIFTGTEIFFSSDYTSIKIKFKARNEKELLKAEQELKEILIKFKEQTGEAQAETPALTRKEVASNKVSIFDEKAINQLIEDVIAVSGAQWSEGSKAIFRETRKAYFAQLRAKAKGEKTSELRIGENFTPLSQMADADRIYVAFEQLKDVLNDPRGAFSEAARNTFVDICFMNGGMGSSLKRDDLLKAVKVYQEAVAAAMQIKDETLRENTLSNLRASLIDGTFLQKDFKGVKIQYGAKSDDLFFVVRDKNGNPELKNITQIKLEKILAEQTNETYKGVSLAMLVSPDSKPLVENLYDGRMNGLEEGETIRTKLNADMEMQDMYPVLKLESDSEGKPSAVSFVTDYEPEVSPENAKPAPGGHGVWLATIVKRILNKKAAGSAISVIGNSDAVASGPIKELVGHMAKDRVGISIISVDRETVDKKGGVFGLAVKEVRDADGKLIKTIKVPTLMERAQAVAVNQKDLFEDLGFKDETQPFNSNTVFINDDVIRRLHDGLIEIFMAGGMSREQAEAKFDALMLPDLIDNTKDGYTKLEGALCSAVLNMNSALEVMRIQNPAVDALLNNILGKDQPLVRLVNANSELRDLVFTPIKFATDFWIQFVNGELVKGDLKSLSPKNHGAVNVECLKDSKDKDYPNYTDVSYFLKNWTRMNIKNLNNLYIDGDKVKMSGLDLRGDVTIRNESSKDFTVSATKLPSTDSLGNKWLFPIVDGKVVLEDMTIIREKTGATRIIVSATQMLRRVEAAFSRQGGKYEIAYRDTNDEIKSTVIANLEQKYGSRITIQENTSKGKAFTITLSEEKAAIALPESTSKLQAAAAAPARDAGQQMLFEKVAAILTSYGNVLRRALGKLLFSDMPFGDMPYYLVSDKYSPDFIGRAREIAKKGVKVNLIMPMPQGNERMPEGIVVEPLDSVTFGQKSADIFKYSQPSAKNSAAVNIFFFDRQTDMNDFAVKTLEYVDEQIEKRQEKAIPSIIDVQVSGKDETLQNMYPDSVLLKTADAVKSANDDILAQGSDIDVFEAGNIGGMLKTAGEMFKNRKKASDMNNSPILPTTIDISKPGVRLEQFSTPSAINDFKEHSVSVVVVKLGADNALPDEAAFRNFLKNMHAAGLKVAVEYSFGENKLGLFNEWAYGLSGQLDKLSGARAGSKMLLDGIKLNLSGMSASDAMEAAQKFDAVRNALNAHRSGALFGVLSPSFVDENIYKKADIRRITLAVDGSGNALNLSALPENSWVELDYGRTIDTQSTDYAAAESNINGIVEKIINNPNVAMIGIPWDVVQSLEKIKDRPFSVIELMRMIPLAKKAAMLRTPKGRFDSGKELALKRNATVEAANQAAAYNVLADLRGGTNLSAAVEEAKSVLPDSDLIKTLAASYEAAADSYKKDCVLKNIEGYLLGALENTELAAYAKVSGSDLNFVVAENKALLAKAMVNAKLLKVSSEPLNREGEDNAVNVLKQEANMQLQLALKRISDAKDGPFAKDAFANMQEAINILDSLIDSGALSVDSKPIALSELITLLALYADRVPKTAVDKVGDNLAEMVAGARATLVAA